MPDAFADCICDSVIELLTQRLPVGIGIHLFILRDNVLEGYVLGIDALERVDR